MPGRVKATYGTGVFVLGHVGDEVPEPAGGLLPTVAWRIDGRMEYAIDGGVFAAGAMLEWMCRELGMAERPAALSELARERRGHGGARVLPALAGLGAPWWKPGGARSAGRDSGGTKRAHVARAALEGIAWRVADVVAAMRETVEVRSLRVDGGLTNEPLLLQLQADTIGVRVDAAGADATVLGAAALGPWAPGVIPSLAEAAELLPVDRSVEPRQDDDWRTREHERWKAFVLARIALSRSRPRPGAGGGAAAGGSPVHLLLLGDAHALVELDRPDRTLVALVHPREPRDGDRDEQHAQTSGVKLAAFQSTRRPTTPPPARRRQAEVDRREDAPRPTAIGLSHLHLLPRFQAPLLSCPRRQRR